MRIHLCTGSKCMRSPVVLLCSFVSSPLIPHPYGYLFSCIAVSWDHYLHHWAQASKKPVNLEQTRLCCSVLMVQYAPCYSRIIGAKSLAIKSVLLKLIGSVGSHLICILGMRKRVLRLVGSLGRNSLIMANVTLEPCKPKISVSKSVQCNLLNGYGR